VQDKRVGFLPDKQVFKSSCCLPSKHRRFLTSQFLLLDCRFYCYSSIPSKIAPASTVVQSPRLSPIADWVIFIVRTILFEIR
jgi:hypothetical protein